MRTALKIDEDLLADAERLTGLKERTDLIREALTALIERESARKLAHAGGTEPGLHSAPGRQAESLSSADAFLDTIVMSEDDETSALHEALERLEALGALGADWDGYGGVKPTLPATFAATTFLLVLARSDLLPGDTTFDVIPVPTGGIQLEWTAQQGAIEVEVDHAGRLSWLVERADGTYDESPGDPTPTLGETIAHLSRVTS
jgi:hypothetical protein